MNELRDYIVIIWLIVCHEISFPRKKCALSQKRLKNTKLDSRENEHLAQCVA